VFNARQQRYHWEIELARHLQKFWRLLEFMLLPAVSIPDGGDGFARVCPQGYFGRAKSDSSSERRSELRMNAAMRVVVLDGCRRRDAQGKQRPEQRLQVVADDRAGVWCGRQFS